MASGIDFCIKDSGERQKFDTGAVRDTQTNKGRFDLITPVALRRLAKHYEGGSKKYGDRNWEKGIPLGRYIDSAMRHLVDLMELKTDEDHAIACAWNMFGFVHTAEKIAAGLLPPELDDIGFVKNKVHLRPTFQDNSTAV